MSFSPLTVIIILVLGVLIFGKNLPEVARQIGSALLEFRKGVGEWKELGKDGKRKSAAVSGSAVSDSKVPPEPDEPFEPLGTKFVPPPVKERELE